ncbi:MAG TPA: chemotaxis protein CheD [Candidatus Methanoculleus thermohydrogenotrophicum]|nr:chemotaxis protein CheD [Candidatus Methanoculleus thermohydrogenotrophicum]NLM81664.1 chemotaxis protein CheD [Candidatus Methanoculleus thermohydrogenotrophicum]HOB17531.1 chemotaxis protein CheD [Candidatus Methanoculleus thermohydrogenotrophicum]HPZ37687.1 chemotaxis protein CheD [Candidatus Methanoculleus thermohydrogenotrophicum]HQC90790.1 chemotaxis protein CheD [Candidatus Methanoculleus thermohydrogenotrophicum]
MEDDFFGEENAVILGLGELRVGTCPMGTIGLGSCIALVLHDQRHALGGLAHIMLPESRGNTDRPGKFADTATTSLLQEMERLGSTTSTIVANVIGGASMFSYSANSLNIGERNTVAVKDLLDDLGIRIAHEETGGRVGRSVYYWPEKKGRLIIKRADGTCTEL